MQQTLFHSEFYKKRSTKPCFFDQKLTYKSFCIFKELAPFILWHQLLAQVLSFEDLYPQPLQRPDQQFVFQELFLHF